MNAEGSSSSGKRSIALEAIGDVSSAANESNSAMRQGTGGRLKLSVKLSPAVVCVPATTTL